MNTTIRIVLCNLLIFLGGYQYTHGQEKIMDDDEDESSIELNEPALEGTSSNISQLRIKERSIKETKVKSTKPPKPTKKQVDKKQVQKPKNNQQKIKKPKLEAKKDKSIKTEVPKEIRQNRRNPAVNNSLKRKKMKAPKNETGGVKKSNTKMTSKGSGEMGRKQREERFQKIIEKNKKKKALLKKEQ